MSKSESRKRTGWIPPIRCFPEEHEIIKEKAADCAMSVGQYVLQCGLGRITKTKTDMLIIEELKNIHNELKRLGGLQKHLYKESNGGLSAQYADALQATKIGVDECIAAVKRIG